jgi:hypothetical protein
VLEVGVLPPKGSCSFGVSANVTHELAGEIFDGGENSASDDLSFDTGEPDFHLVQPGRIGGCEVQLNARMGLQESCLVGSSTGALARRLILGLYPGFPPSCPFRSCRVPVSSARHIARSVRISRTTRSCTVRSKTYETYQTGATAEIDP